MSVAELSTLLQGGSAPIQRILITGASGWIGRETISILKPILGDGFSHRVTLAGSRDAIIVVDEHTHRVQRLQDIRTDRKFDVVIHLAFLTQDRVTELGPDEFSRQNRDLTSTVYHLCQKTNAEYVFLASSGAADPEIWANYKDPSKKLYGQLKMDEEELFQSLDGAFVQIGRIWSISGGHIQKPQKYALGDFILQAQSTGNIEMHTAQLVERAYVDVGEMMQIFILNLLKGATGTMDSGGFKTSLHDLAKLILKELRPDGKVILPNESSLNEADIYVPNVEPFNHLARALRFRLSSLQEQIRTTAKALSSR